MSLDALKQEISQTVQGLIYTSEQDHPVEPLVLPPGEGTPRERVLAASGLQGQPVEEVDAGRFFGPLESDEDWYGEDERKAATQFGALHRLLGERLQGLSVLKVGAVDKRIYVIGTTADGAVAGVATRAVET